MHRSRTQLLLTALALGVIGCQPADEEAEGTSGATEATSSSVPTSSSTSTTVDSSTSNGTTTGNATASTSSSTSASTMVDPTSTGSDPQTESSGDPACTDLDDEFDDPASLDCWTNYDPGQYTLLDVDATLAGHLLLEPINTDGWFDDGDGPFLYKMLGGDFVVETHVAAVDRNAPDMPPAQAFNSAGLVLRDPASAPAAENWLMYNLGYQDDIVGTEGKTTTNSSSELTLVEGLNSGRLRVCRIGREFHMYRWLDDETDWTLEHTYARPDLPDDLQVGIVGNAYTAPPDLQAQFDYVRFGTATDARSCTAPIR